MGSALIYPVFTCPPFASTELAHFVTLVSHPLARTPGSLPPVHAAAPLHDTATCAALQPCQPASLFHIPASLCQPCQPLPATCRLPHLPALMPACQPNCQLLPHCQPIPASLPALSCWFFRMTAKHVNDDNPEARCIVDVLRCAAGGGVCHVARRPCVIWRCSWVTGHLYVALSSLLRLFAERTSPCRRHSSLSAAMASAKQRQKQLAGLRAVRQSARPPTGCAAKGLHRRRSCCC